ncbi:phage tail tape measure protein [Fictibacillus sp. 5RED26]|uniref:phage tail tape measure protein n=1 Tax=Fictibacillus sp. 5RED26 TaxID=2745876 RepID=UPI0018CFAA25|nr:phage tail tape measure protein [Fictibacillus sp. 5RED26]MBH0159112.1 phage tail tape measure protein [Fictibacillus sp. 5RED26]
MAQNSETKVTFRAFNKDFNKAIGEMKAESSKLRLEFALQEAQLQETGTEADQLTAKINFLGNAQKIAAQKVAATEAQLQKARQVFGENSKEAERLSKNLTQAKLAEQKLANEITQVNKKLEDQANTSKKVSEALKNTGENMQSVGTTVGTAFTAAGVAVGTGLGVAVKKAMDFDAQLSRVGAIANASKEELQALRQSALDLGASTSKSATEIAMGQEALAALGFTAKDIIGAMPGVISAAEASGSDMAQTAEVMASTLNIFGMEASKATKVADILAKTANVSAADLTDMQYALKYAGPPAAALGVSLEELSASIGIMTNAGMQGEQAGTTLRSALLSLLDPSEENSKLMDKMGIAVTDAQGNFVGLSNLVQNLSTSMKGQTDTQKAATLASLVGTEAVSGMLSLMAAGPSEIEKMTSSLEKSGGASEEAAKKMKDNLKGTIDELSGAFETMAISIGTSLAPTLEKLAGFIQGIADKFNSLSPSTQTFIAISAAVGVALTLLIGVVGFLTAALGAMAAAEWAVILPIAGIIAAITAAIVIITALAVVIYKNWDAIKAKTIEAFEAVKTKTLEVFTFIKDWISNTWTSIKTSTETILNSVKSFITNSWNNIKASTMSIFTAVSSFFRTIWNAIKSTILTVVNTIVTHATALYSRFKDSINTIFNGIKTYFSGVWNLIKNIFLGAVLLIVDLVTGDFTALKRDAIAIFNNLKNSFKQIWEGIKQVFSGALSFIKTYITTVWNGIQSLSSTVWNAIKTSVTSAASSIKNGVVNAWNTIKTTSSNIWNGIKNIVSNSVTNIKNGVINGFESLKNSVSNAMKNVKTAIENGWNQAKNFLTGIDLRTIGKNIIEGLVNGISSMAGNVKQKVKDIVNSIPKNIRELLDIHSPSRVTYKLGEYTGEGFAKGITAKKKDAEEAARKIAEATKKAFESEKAYIEKKKFYNKLSLTEELAIYEKYLKKYKKGSEEREYYEREVYRVKKEIYDKLKDLNDQYAQKVKDTSKKLKEDEIKAEQDYKNQVKSIKEKLNDDLISAKTDYEQQVLSVNQRLAESEKSLTETYNKAVDDRAKALYSFAGLFDQVTRKEVSGEALIDNLSGQVSAFEDYQSNMDQLASKGVSQELLKELQDAGPKSVDEIKALNSLSAEQLQQYVLLWQQKSSLARQQATKESEGLRLDTQIQIQQLRAESAMQLEQLRVEYVAKVSQLRQDAHLQMLQAKADWVRTVAEMRAEAKAEMAQYQKELNDQIKEITKGTKENFDVMAASMKTIGKDTMKGLMSGLTEMTGPLMKQAKSIADSVSATIKKALDIHSPSRVMEWMGEMVGEGLVQGMNHSVTNISSMADQLASAAVPRIEVNSTGTSGTSNQGPAKIEQKVIINSPTPLSPAETARLNRQALQQFAFQLKGR